MNDDDLSVLIDSVESGHGLSREFYCDDGLYQRDLERVWQTGWLFVAHTCEIPKPGDYVTFELDHDSLIVIRDDDGKAKALYNTCRHRGTLICHQPKGHVGRLVCPYHQWTYGRGGALMSCRGMQDDVDKSQLGLVAAHVHEFEGLIYVCLADDPPSFDDAHQMMAPAVKPQGLGQAKIAKAVEYDVAANWKIVWENNRECYHCNANHPQYIKANFDHYNADDTSQRIQQQIDTAVDHSEKKWADAGLSVTHRQSGMACFPDPDRGIWCSANRTPLADGYVSESMDGRQVAPLMGDYSDPDVGTLRMRTMPNMWMHASCDHAVTTRLLPAGPHSTKVRVAWLVHQDAEEGRDYNLDKLMPFWQLTSEQDWELCAYVQRGVKSHRYRPGPFSTYKEYNVDAFVRWYLKELSQT